MKWTEWAMEYQTGIIIGLLGIMLLSAIGLAVTYKQSSIELCKYHCDTLQGKVQYADGYSCQCVKQVSRYGPTANVTGLNLTNYPQPGVSPPR